MRICSLRLEEEVIEISYIHELVSRNQSHAAATPTSPVPLTDLNLKSGALQAIRTLGQYHKTTLSLASHRCPAY